MVIFTLNCHLCCQHIFYLIISLLTLFVSCIATQKLYICVVKCISLFPYVFCPWTFQSQDNNCNSAVFKKFKSLNVLKLILV